MVEPKSEPDGEVLEFTGSGVTTTGVSGLLSVHVDPETIPENPVQKMITTVYVEPDFDFSHNTIEQPS